jgi:hypothetical protein
MKYLKSFHESHLVSVDPDMEKIDRTKELSEEEFLNILHTKCKNFSFMNDLLWRGKPKKYDLELFEPSYRNTKGMTFVNFFIARGLDSQTAGIIGVGYLLMLGAWVSGVWNVHNSEIATCVASTSEMTEFKDKLMKELAEKQAAEEANATAKPSK